MVFGSEWQYLSSFVKKSAQSAADASRASAKMFFVKVVTADGYFANVIFEPSEKGATPLIGIPIIQSPYHSQPILPGDCGLLINLQQNVGATLESKTAKKLGSTDYFVFLPLIKKRAYKGSPLKHTISSPDLQTFITLGNDGIVQKVVAKTEIDTNTYTLEATQSIKAKTQNFALEGDSIDIKGATTIEGDSIDIKGATTIEGDSIDIKGATTIEGDNIEMSSSAPMKVGDLATILNDLCSALSAFMTTPTAPGSPAAADPGFVAKITKIQSAVAKGFK